MPRFITKSKKRNSFPFQISTIAIFALAAFGSLYYILLHPFNLTSNAAFNYSQKYVIYDDKLAPGWQDWSWDDTNNFAFRENSFSVNNVIASTITRGWGGLYLHTDVGVNSQVYDTLEFSLKGTQSGQKFGVRLQTVDDNQIGQEVYLAKVGGNPTPAGWTAYAIPFDLFSKRIKTPIGGIIIQDEAKISNQTFYVDNILFVQSTTALSPTATPTLLPTSTPTLKPTVPAGSTTGANPTPKPTTTPNPTPTTPPTTGRVYPWHTNIISTTFWVGEIFNASLSDGSQVCSTYDVNWAYHWSGINAGTVPASAPDCPGSIVGGCDGVGGYQNCKTEKRTAANNYFPTQVTAKENPFYLDLPFDDINDSTAYGERCQVIPWANDPGYAGNCTNQNFSYMKNRWVRIIGPNGNTCYGQVEDAGPSHGNLYHDANYVFGSNNAQPVQGQFNNAGMDVSPALNGCLGFAELDGENDHVNWQFVDNADVPNGPWKIVVTTSGVSE